MKHWLHFKKRGSLFSREYDVVAVAQGTGPTAECVFKYQVLC